MDSNSDSDKSYDKISWDEFCVSVTESDSEGSSKDEKLLNDEIEKLDLNKSEDEQNSDKDEKLLNDEIEKLDLNKSEDEQNSDKDEKLLSDDIEKLELNNSEDEKNSDVEYSSGNSSYSYGSVDEDSDGSVGSSNPDDLIHLDEFIEPKADAVIYKKRKLCALQVPGEFKENPKAHFKSREKMEIKDLVKSHALPFLPPKSLARFKLVSKDWNQWISSPLLSHRQTHSFKNLSGFFCHVEDKVAPTYIPVDKSSSITLPTLGFLPEAVTIRSSSYGLLLCQSTLQESDYYVCNPVIKQYRKIIKPNFYHGQEPTIVLAFDPSELNFSSYFEIICAVTVIDHPLVYFEIYSSETNSWRLSSTECFVVEGTKVLSGGFYLNKNAYFVTDFGEVIGFDPKSEVCGVLSLPVEEREYDEEGVLTRMDGELCYMKVSRTNESEYSLSVYGGMHMGLKKCIPVFFNNSGFGYDKECRVLPFVTNDGDDVAVLTRRGLWVYRRSEEKVKFMEMVAGKYGGKYFPFVESLVCLLPE